MAVEFVGVALAARAPRVAAEFWGGLLGRELVETGPGRIELAPSDSRDLRIAVVEQDVDKRGQNTVHVDLTSDRPTAQDDTVARALGLGSRLADVGQTGDEGHVVLADPDGNEFCVIEAGNRFLAGTGPIGALNCDGTRKLGVFWSEALGWPLVWDQDDETAIQPPHGGFKITWSGPPLLPWLNPERWWFEVRGSEQDRERLLQLGATTDDTGGLRDPDGNRFVLSVPSLS